ncbi:glycosyl transferase [alpha proteobacterium U9-1i]|nr:glycosyl transferase [alpha proteobacterium U9-1i]
MSERIDIALGYDRRYAAHAATVVSSIVRNAPGAEFRFLMLHADVDRATQERVESVAPGAVFVWTEVGEKDLPAYATRGHLNRTVLFRLGLETLAPADCTRLIYIDSDMVVLGDIRDFWNADLRGAPLGAVLDAYIDAAEFAQRWELPYNGELYFNAGLQLIDLAKVREQKLFSRALEFVVRNDEKLLLGDQDALNYVFWGRWIKLDPVWNAQKFLDRDGVARELSGKAPALVHFIGTEKPWMANIWHPWAWIYWDAVRHTPFADDVARDFNVTPYHRARYLLRWLIKRPQANALAR